ncbi:MAG: hypothetical protein AMXMBFR84_37050 [Candidatus Hydrogenedentota bacterium]
MRKHVVVVGKNSPLAEAIAKAANKSNIGVEQVDPKSPLPPATAAVAGGVDDIKAMLSVADQLGQQHEELLRIIAWTGDVREGFPKGDSDRVHACAAKFGEFLKLDIEEQLALERAALVRGIGKFCIPNAVLLKRGLLTHDEWTTLREYPSFGAEVVSKTSVLKDTEAIIRYYRECHDGTGYPDGLEGDAIPRLAQALLIADVFCAMTSLRPYRDTKNSIADATAYLKAEKGKKFRPDLVEAFLKGRPWQGK